MPSNWLDEFYNKWFPTIGVNRAAARLRTEEIASYRGAIATRTGTGFQQSTSFARGTAADRRSLAAMRDRGRRIFRENPVGKSILQTEVTNVIADGFAFHAAGYTMNGDVRAVAKAWNSEADDRFEEWFDQADFRGMLDGASFQRQAYRSSRKDGDGGIVLVDQGGDSKLQYIPGDLIKTPDDRLGDQLIADGVEVDPASRPIAYHILDTDEYGKRLFTRVPANNFIYLVPEMDDDMAVRGPTCYSTIFEKLDQLDGYVDGVATAARMSTIFGLIFKSDGSAKQLASLPTLTNSQGQQQRAVTLENGSVKYIGTKDDVVQVNPTQPMQQTPDFIRALMRLIGMPFDMPLELVAHDMSTVTFASARIGLLGYYRAQRARQKWFRKRCLDRIYQWWISRERKRQSLGLPNSFVNPFPEMYWPHMFTARAWDYTDPVSEAQSDFLQIDMGTKSPQDVSAERGRDWDETCVKNAAATAWRKLNISQNEIHSILTRDTVVVNTPTTTPPAQTPVDNGESDAAQAA